MQLFMRELLETDPEYGKQLIEYMGKNKDRVQLERQQESLAI